MPNNPKEEEAAKQTKMMSFASAAAQPPPLFTWDHRPAVPSPLSSSPIRASSPLSPIDRNTLPQRQVQSSPIQPPRFKYATRSSRPNPLVRKRAEAQEERRRTFLENVKSKSENKAWQRRDIEGQFLKNSFLAHVGHLQVDAPTLSDADIDDAVAFSQEQPLPDEDDMMLDDIPEEEELEAMVAFYETQQQKEHPSQRHQSPELSDEEGYDDLFQELISQEQQSSADHTDDAIYMDHDEL